MDKFLFMKYQYQVHIWWERKNMSFQEVLIATRPAKDVQHEFMYTHMVPTMQNILFQLQFTLISQATTSALETLTFQTQFYTNPRSIANWDWNVYFNYLSLVGLQDTAAFKNKYPDKSDANELFLEYDYFPHEKLKTP